MKHPVSAPAFFLETPTPAGRILLWSQLTAGEENTLTLLPWPGGQGWLAGLWEQASPLGSQRLLDPDEPERLAGLMAPGLRVYCTRKTPPPGLMLGVCEQQPRPLFPLPGEQRETMTVLCKKERREERRTARLMAAAVSLLAENRRLQREVLQKEKLQKAVENLSRRETTPHSPGGETMRFLTAMTPQGLRCPTSTLPALTDRAILIEDPWGGVAPVVLGLLRQRLKDRGERLITCPSPLFPREVEALILPDRRLCLVTHTPLCPLPGLPNRQRAIHAGRFAPEGELERYRQRMRLLRRMAAALLAESARAAASAAATRQALAALWAPVPAQMEEELLALGLRQLGQAGEAPEEA